MTTPRESQHLDHKSLRLVTVAKTDFSELAQSCVCFANAAGGTLLIGIEDDAEVPPADQRVEPSLLDRIRKRVGELTVNVQVVPELKRDENGGEYIALTIPRATGIASTSDGRYFLCVGASVLYPCPLPTAEGWAHHGEPAARDQARAWLDREPEVR